MFLKTPVIVLLSLIWLQAGVREIWENQAFVDDYCYGNYKNRFIQGYCAFHTAAADYTSLQNLLLTFCFASKTALCISAFLIAVVNARLFAPQFKIKTV